MARFVKYYSVIYIKYSFAIIITEISLLRRHEKFSGKEMLCGSAEIPIEAPNKKLDFKDKNINRFLWVMLPSLSRPAPSHQVTPRPVPFRTTSHSC